MSLKHFLSEYPVISILIVLWVMGVVTFATVQVFTGFTEVNGAVATAYAALLGLPPIAFGIYQWRMGKTDK